MSNYLLLASELYSLPILRPLADEALARGHRVAWLACDALAKRLRPQEVRLRSSRELRLFSADATFCTVNEPPRALPGLQIQVFHGLNMHKRDPRREGQLRVQGLFDLYCTHGPATTGPLREVARERGDFVVVETGWPKIDVLFGSEPRLGEALGDMVLAAARGRPIVMYTSTFNPPMSQSRECLQAIETLVQRGDRYWLLCLHPLSAPDIVECYQELVGENAVFVDAESLPGLLPITQALVGDTTSVVDEFALLGKPIVTVRHHKPQPFMIDVRGPQHIDEALIAALSGDGRQRCDWMKAYAETVHPYRDGRSAARVLDAAEALVSGALTSPQRRTRWFWHKRRRTRKQMHALLPAPGLVADFMSRMQRKLNHEWAGGLGSG